MAGQVLTVVMVSLMELFYNEVSDTSANDFNAPEAEKPMLYIVH